ncbi:MAG: hypothetical protein N7Q72_07225, partial [Spiroplasma sp. Tabriz.8]|nr:hypothetical protein [Spiroplasma sp. Tabriz.8]
NKYVLSWKKIENCYFKEIILWNLLTFLYLEEHIHTHTHIYIYIYIYIYKSNFMVPKFIFLKYFSP